MNGWIRSLTVIVILVAAVAPTAGAEASQQPTSALKAGNTLVEAGAKRVWSFGPVAASGRRVILTLEARLDVTKSSGTSRCMHLAINNVGVALNRGDGTRRCLNKGETFNYSHGRTPTWSTGGTWQVLAEPDFERAKRQPWFKGTDPYLYVFDVTDMVRSKSENAFRIHNTNKATRLVVKQVLIQTVAMADAQPASAPARNPELKAVGGEVFATLPEIRLPGQDYAAMSFHVPADQAGKSVTLSFRCRLDSTDTGFHHDLRIVVNDRMVNGFRDRLTQRIVNKNPPRFKYPKYGYYNWCNTDEGWAVIRGASYTPTNRHVAIYGEDPFHMIVDVADLLKPGRNTLRFENARSHSTKERLIVSDVELRACKRPVAAATPTLSASVPEDARWSFACDEEGSLLLSSDGVRMKLASAFVNEAGAMQWSAKGDGAGTWRNERLAVTRTLHREGDWLVIRDSLTSSGGLTGAICRYGLSMPGLPFPDARLCGFPYAEISESRERGNPTVYASAGDAGVGLAAESDVLRHHAAFQYLPQSGAVRIEDRQLVASDKAVVHQLTLYLPARADYFRFINALRKRWKVPAVESPLYAAFVYPETFDDWSDGQLRDYFSESGVTHVVTGTGLTLPDRPEVRTLLGLGIGRDEVAPRRQGWRTLRERIRRVAPQVRFLLKVHCYFNLPARPDDVTNYADALMRDPEGRSVAHPQWGDTFIPTLDNRYGREWRATIDRVADEVGADGFYWDESTQPGLPSELLPDKTWGMWDGVTGQLDDNGKLISKVGMVGLLTLPFREAVIREQLAKGRFWCMGGEPRSSALQALPVHWWRECQHHAYYAYAGHLGPAQAYVGGGADLAYARRLLAAGNLPCRLPPKTASPLTQAVFPFTTQEIGDGWIRGKGKLVSMRSGRFTWPAGARNPRVTTVFPDNRVESSDAAVSADGFIRIDVPPEAVVVVKESD